MPPPDPALVNRLRKMQRHHGRWARRQGITCHRVYERDLPDHPMIVDRYGEDVVVWTYDRTRDDTPEQAAVWEESAVDAVREALDVTADRLFVKHRARQRGADQYGHVASEGAVRVVEEGGLRFEVNLSDYLDTGLFLDHRDTRAMVRAASQGRHVLNLFAYTGSFTVYAAAGGARKTVTVDMSRTYCAWAERNLALNGFEPGTDHRVVRADVIAWLDQEADSGRQYELIVLDPPTFSNSKKMDRSLAVTRDHPWLLDRCLALLPPGGEILFSTNDRGFKPAEATFALFDEAEDITARTIPPDFRNKRIHRCFRLRRS